MIGATPLHAERVALMTHRILKNSGFDNTLCSAAAQAALLHDCALTEYFDDEGGFTVSEKDVYLHCEAGERCGK